MHKRGEEEREERALGSVLLNYSDGLLFLDACALSSTGFFNLVNLYRHLY